MQAAAKPASVSCRDHAFLGAASMGYRRESLQLAPSSSAVVDDDDEAGSAAARAAARSSESPSSSDTSSSADNS